MDIRRSLIVAGLMFGVVACGDSSEPSDQGEETVGQAVESLPVRRCAGPEGLPCGQGQYCRSIDESGCPSKTEYGVCAPRPSFCTKEFAPVCGCDGQTYGNACSAAAAGVSVAHKGECGAEEAPFCGGIAGIPCPGSGKCVDDPSDDCSPKTGGADCGGICICPVVGTCPPGSQWDSSPQVCGCVEGDACPTNPCAVVLCRPGTICVERNCSASCEPR